MGSGEFLAHLVALGELDGNEWDWSRLAWRERK